MADDKIILETELIDGATDKLDKLQGKVDDLSGEVDKSSESSSRASFSFTEFNQALEIGSKVIDAAKNAYQQIIAPVMETANSVRELMNITGDSAENTSRVIQLTDDYKLTIDDLTTAQRKLATQNKTLSVETIAELADGYKKLNTGAERQNYLTENLGRSGKNWAELLSKQSSEIKNQASSISNLLIYNQKLLDDARKLEIAQDNFDDTLLAYKTIIAKDIIPALADWINIDVDKAAAWENLLATGKKWYEFSPSEMEAAYQEAKAHREAAEAANFEAQAKDNDTASSEELLLAAQKLSEQHTTELGLITSIATESQNYSDKQETLAGKINDAKLALQLALKQGWWPTSDKVIGLKTDLQKLEDEYGTNADAHKKATDQIVYNNVLQKLSVDGITDAEFAQAQQIGVALGVFTQSQADEAIALNGVTTAAVDGKITMDELALAVQNGAGAVQDLWDKVKAGEDKAVTITINTVYHGDTLGLLTKSLRVDNNAYTGRTFTGQAEGGDYIVNKPTLFMAGEAGTERATFTPTGKKLVDDNGKSNLSDAKLDKLINLMGNLPDQIGRSTAISLQQMGIGQ